MSEPGQSVSQPQFSDTASLNDQSPPLPSGTASPADASVAPALCAGIVSPAGLLERLQQSAGGPASSMALLIIDIDGFHSINQAHGFLVGDCFLDMVGRRLADRLRTGDFITRLGGDEFAVLLSDVFDSASAVAAARETLRALSEPFYLNDRPHAASACVGRRSTTGSGADASGYCRRGGSTRPPRGRGSPRPRAPRRTTPRTAAATPRDAAHPYQVVKIST